MEGYTATRQIRSCIAIDADCRSYALALSGEEKKARAAGCDEYVPKRRSGVVLIKINQMARAATMKNLCAGIGLFTAVWLFSG
jgi:CheY-like chemotaxis protein